jgi:hypothetical protein
VGSNALVKFPEIDIEQFNKRADAWYVPTIAFARPDMSTTTLVRSLCL